MIDRDRIMHSLHPLTFEYIKETDEQITQMDGARAATKLYAETLDALLPEGPDKTFILRTLRTLALWVNVCVTRRADGTPRHVEDPDA